MLSDLALKKKRMLKYFIDAAADIIKNEGAQKITARKVAQKAGYTNSTIYNYFEELSHLVYFASMRFTVQYHIEASAYLTEKNALDAYLLTWECFCRYSYKDPHIYHRIFIADLGENPKDMLQQYYDVYEEDLLEVPKEYLSLTLEPDLTDRSKAILVRAVKQGRLPEEEIEPINNMSILMWKGMLTTIINKRSTIDIDEAVQQTMSYIRKLV